MKSTISVIVLTLISSTKILVKADVANKCNESKATAKIVNACPKTAREWNEAAKKKGCRNITNSCTSFEYHCVMNAWRNETIEVCAPSWSIVGMSCAEYNFGGKRIQKGKAETCNTCPTTYLSTESYKYQECYVMKSKKMQELQGTTESAIISLITPEHNISSIATAWSQELNYTYTNSVGTPSPLIISIICIVVGIPVLAIVALVVIKWRKNLSGSGIYRPTIEENRVRSEEYSTSETMDSFEEEKEQLTREISNNHGLYYESNDTKDRERI